ncbi:MAG TPA: biotin--[acetyl-CoA-carboxylase] ligase [Chthoniobacterales bacterium]|jgi:BirA family biotin operon repressor/biotin-[acetyl-CoA-carboxylase] ligase|nr:biotin--[acetyl-CoA-carboxylase] ligase [Chthoniobacterales bacterium]
MRDPREIELIRLLLPVSTPIELGELLERTGIHSDELPVFMEDLRQSGFVFSQTQKTIQAIKEPESLLPEMILARLQTQTIGRDVLVFRETSSTNDRARQAGVAGAGEGLVIFAESQTGGRGTRGRKWVSTAGVGLWFSILLRTRVPVAQWPLLVQMAAVACAEAIEKWVEQKVRIKPPNDLMLGDGKLAGFLLETSNTWDFQVLGIGLNVRSAPLIDGYPTAAIEQFARTRVPRAALAAELLNCFETWYLKRTLAEMLSAFDRRI